MTIAFFDFDRTIISKNSASMWVKAELRDGYISPWQALLAGGWLFKYHLGFAKLDDAMRKAVTALEGRLESEMRERSRNFFHSELRDLVRPGAEMALRHHRNQGDQLVLLTASSVYVAEVAAEMLGLDGYICTRFQVDNEGRYTGAVQEPLCFGMGKVHLAIEYAKQKGMNLGDCVFYTDSNSDLPLLEVIGHPVAVNPDPRLRKTAHSRGWEIVDWGSPAETTQV
jgi:HAD superfamily hydrolase (TIGR01490 family)